MTEAAGHNKKQNLLQTSKCCHYISRRRNKLDSAGGEVQEAG